jgi:hypothetical protein
MSKRERWDNRVSKVSVLLRQLDKQMSPGPWRHEPEHCDNGYEPDRIFSDKDYNNPKVILDMAARPNSSKDASGICDARNLLLSAAEEIEQLEKQRDEALRIGVTIPDDILAKMLTPPICGVSEVSASLGLSAGRTGGCGKIMRDPREWYRCADCEITFHKACIKNHFGVEANKVVALEDGGAMGSHHISAAESLPLPPSDSKANI